MSAAHEPVAPAPRDYGDQPGLGQPARARAARLVDDRYSRRVAFLKRALPGVGVGLLLLVVAWPQLRPLIDSVRLRVPAIDVHDAREIRMTSPRYAGVDRTNRPYVVTATVARQVPNKDDLMSLEEPRADMNMHSGAWVMLASNTGVYQPQAQLLDLFGDVNLYHDNGTRFVTATARVNMSDNSAAGQDAIEGHGPSGDIWGQGFRILDRGNTIIFTGKSRLILKGALAARQVAAPPELPASVAAAASRVADSVPGAASVPVPAPPAQAASKPAGKPAPGPASTARKP